MRPDGRLKILFLCTGNSCRSQMAEGWARALKSDQIEAYSAGIETHGLNPRAVRVMAEAKIEYKMDDGGRSVVLDANPEHLAPEELATLIKSIEQEMKDAAKALEFERAAGLRDQLVELRRIEVERKVVA